METQMILQFIPLVPRKRHAWCWFVMALAMICLASPLGSASAGPNLSYSDLTITVSTQGTFLPQKADGLTLPPGLPGLVTVQEQPGLWAHFPGSGSVLPGGYTKSLMTTTRFGGVGISGLQISSTEFVQAIATFSQNVTNTGDGAGALFLEYTIPGLEASILAGPSVDPHGNSFESDVDVAFFATHVLADGTQLPQQTVFDYRLTFERLGPNNLYSTIRSPDLLTDQRDGARFIAGDIQGVQYAEFDGDRRLGTLRPGERLDLFYVLFAGMENRLGIDEVGFQALVGDPFQLSGSSGFRVGLEGVPEPSSLLLLGLGVGGLVAYTRCKFK